jgi:riboflavin-specific deaminase-like protein
MLAAVSRNHSETVRNEKNGRSELPFVFINVAATADGKLAPAGRKYIPFGSARDKTHLLELRATADAVMSGARTVDLDPVKLGPGPAKFRRLRLKHGLAEYNLRIVASGSGTVNPDAEIFKHRFSPIIILTTEKAGRDKLRQLRGLADEVLICGERELDFDFACRSLRTKWNVKRLLCEGGGEINGAMFKAGLVRELHLTLCPMIFGGRQAPTVADGTGFSLLKDAARLKVVSQKRVGGELFLVYKVLPQVMLG